MGKKGSASDIETARALDRAAVAPEDTITLSTGVVLRGRKANPVMLIQVMAAVPRPEPPLYYNKTMAREMENPADPKYLEALKAWQMDQTNRVTDAMIVLGTELVSSPKKLGKPEDNEWLQDYTLFRLPMAPDSESWRYLTWVKFKACQDESDLEQIMKVVGRLSGVSESAVKSAETFPGSDQAPG